MQISPSGIPEGMDYQLITSRVAGDSSFNQFEEMKKTGWRKVPRSRHPTLRTIDPEWIEYGGQLLVERPKLLTERAKTWEQQKADAQVADAVNMLAAAGDDAMVLRVNGREVNRKATPKRKTTIREFFTNHIWSARHWFRTKFSKEYRR